MGNIILKKEGHIAVLSVVRPEALNALSREIVDEIGKMLEAVQKDRDIYCLIFHSDKNFAAGADIKKMAECDETEAKAFCFNPVFDKIGEFPIPTIAAIEGYALGGGMELALCADIRIADRSAKMGFPEVSLGIFPGAGGTIRMPRLIGISHAMELIFSAEQITAERAAEIGLVNHVVEEGQSLDAAKALANRIAKRGPVAVRMAKDVIIKGCQMERVTDGTKYESEQWAKLFQTYDQKEGMRAFMKKRKPVFENR